MVWDLADQGATKLFQMIVPRDLGLPPYRDRTLTNTATGTGGDSEDN